MYYPLLRSKKYECSALIELLTQNKLSKNIIPIIEPVKANQPFKALLKQFFEDKREIAVVQNSSVANYNSFNEEEINKIKLSDMFINAYNLKSDEDVNRIKDKNKKTMVILTDKSELSNIEQFSNDKSLVVIDVNNRIEIRKAKNNSVKNLIELSDGYDKKERNLDYVDDADQSFSIEHLLYKNDGFLGFSDYSIVGDNFSTGGSFPKVVAIHIVYFNKNNELRIHHFTSDPKDSESKDLKLKNGEALEKLVSWYDSKNFDKSKNDSLGLRELRNVYVNKHGETNLGKLKQFSIEHHLEIIGRYLDNNE
ncbi:sce7725 family protein [Fructilactobacillus fructivorans]|uniref:Sce7725 family protein n=1 Tax=Fructilactobacillus fructivorans TaxID=1614 RepID=A0A0C1M7A6_9LACO|nr:sce7725 family protein [Fructilactobacillus fructivorans]KID42274.1 hypothetical protein LfDm3_0203 [Fructilactobacillus fructivorans]MCT0151105.1 hypothetical protein [Fructilactobacillus fructivorans]MCT2867337.1 hypothetical protein [Fructilactobacillus fructivorans]MCT2869144.1 hypothetical protein [Fructilactobacillus fructivorans]MCT2873136.1 hypothetical protein [Fructilactobacillus fructivorans]